MKPDTQSVFPGDIHTSDEPPWGDLEDDIADVISDSMDMDWTSRDGARAVVEYLKKIGTRIP